MEKWLVKISEIYLEKFQNSFGKNSKIKAPRTGASGTVTPLYHIFSEM